MSAHETILLADDDKTARDTLRDLLELEGHVLVAEAGNLGEVKFLVDDLTTKFRVAVLDDCMIDVGDGRKAAEYLRKVRPEVKIVSRSGDLQNYGDLNVQKKAGPNPVLDYLKSL